MSTYSHYIRHGGEGIGTNECTYRLRQGASLFRLTEDLIVKNWEIQGKTKTDWVRGRQFFFADFKGFPISFFWLWNNSWEREKTNMITRSITKKNKQKLDFMHYSIPSSIHLAETNAFQYCSPVFSTCMKDYVEFLSKLLVVDHTHSLPQTSVWYLRTLRNVKTSFLALVRVGLRWLVGSIPEYCQ